MATTLNVRVNGPLEDFIAQNIGETGAYENASEYVRDLIRRDLERVEAERFQALKAELQRAFAAPTSSYRKVTAEEVIERARRRRSR